jgi:hypothetical protein
MRDLTAAMKRLRSILEDEVSCWPRLQVCSTQAWVRFSVAGDNSLGTEIG